MPPKTTTKPLSPGQVAHLFGVSVATVGSWADKGFLRSFRTPGGQRRFRPEDVEAFLPPLETETAGDAA